jgi:hypothetical protein
MESAVLPEAVGPTTTSNFGFEAGDVIPGMRID